MLCFDKASRLFRGGTATLDRLTLGVPNGKLTTFFG